MVREPAQGTKSSKLSLWVSCESCECETSVNSCKTSRVATIHPQVRNNKVIDKIDKQWGEMKIPRKYAAKGKSAKKKEAKRKQNEKRRRESFGHELDKNDPVQFSRSTIQTVSSWANNRKAPRRSVVFFDLHAGRCNDLCTLPFNMARREKRDTCNNLAARD